MLSPIELTQYFIKVSTYFETFCFISINIFYQSWTLDYIDPDLQSSGLKMEIVFKRRITNELLTTYLPSSLLLLISYATTFFKSFYFEAQVTVNLSVMLVTTNLFIRLLIISTLVVKKIFKKNIFLSVMEKLPVTSYIRLVDIWLIFGQLIPFVQVNNWIYKFCFVLHFP